MMNESHISRDAGYLNNSEIIDKKPIIENRSVTKIETAYVPKQKIIEAGGISKHLYSTNPSANVDENIYTMGPSTKQLHSYTTIKGEKVKVGTKEKINPFNVQGVPGCISCGGSGWKGKTKHPHPCNECAKKTVPIIDTNIVKTSPQTIVSQQVPIQRRVTSEVPFVTGIQETRKVTMPLYEERIEQVEVPRYEPVTEVKKVPVTKYDTVTENIPVTRQITRTEYEDVPVTYMQPKTEVVNVRKVVPATEYQTYSQVRPPTQEERRQF
jgi:hypothetical protein